MMIASWGRAVALACLMALPFVSGAAQAQMQTVTIHAYDAKGKETGKCIRGLDAISEGPGGYRLADCDKKAANQKFRFDVGTGGPLFQVFGETADSDGIVVLMAILGSDSDNSWFPGALVSRVSGNSPGYLGAAREWRWAGKQISNKDEKSGKWCLTTLAGQGKELRIDKCSNTATLTQWDVKLAK